MVALTIEGIELTAPEGTTVLDAAQQAGIYIPHLCSHPDLPPSEGLKPAEVIYRGGKPISNNNSAPEKYEGCQLCVVEIEGMEGFPRSCVTPVADGMVVHTDTPELQEFRRDKLAFILAKHPHACLTCAQREGCAREPCSLNIPVDSRCCPLLGNCELQRVADYVGIKKETPRYVFEGLPIIKDEPLFERNYNLCIGCTRCIRVCQDVRGVGALGFVFDSDGRAIVGTIAPTLEESVCKFCGACVEVCPTGALTDKKSFTETQKEEALVPCKATCPAGIDIPRYVHFIAEEKFAEAAAVILESVPLPRVLGYICHHPCEEACRRGELNEPISICALKRFVAENYAELWRKNLKPALSTGKQVAIVGSGPAGLTAAYYLARLGHSVTVFEKQSEPGGMLRAGIPSYRLPKEVVQKEIEEILSHGIELRVNAPIGDGLALEELKNQGYQAIFLSVGAQLSRRLNIEGIDLDGVLWGVDFLREVNFGQEVKMGGRVIVIGGGNVAIDVALTALRLGAKEVQLACLESRDEMPAFEWEIQEAIEEGVVLNVSWGPKRILGANGNARGIELIRCTSVFDQKGRFNPSYDESVTKTIDADLVIMAIGQAIDLSFLGEGSEVKSAGGAIKVNDGLATDAEGIFAGGDAVSGPASVVEAIAMGRKAAISIDKYLGGNGVIEEKLIPIEKPNPWLGKEEGFAQKPRVQMPHIPLEQRLTNFSLIELGFDEKMAIEEARRCLRCDLRLQISEVTLPPRKEIGTEFNSQNVSEVPEIDGIYQLLDEQKNIIYIKGTINLRRDLEAQLATYEKARYFIYEENRMFSKKESELLQQFIAQYGELPEGNRELEELF